MLEKIVTFWTYPPSPFAGVIENDYSPKTVLGKANKRKRYVNFEPPF
jgi:hypothetical protein